MKPEHDDKTQTHVVRLRETGAAFARNADDFPRVTLAYAKALWRARRAVGGDDAGFGRWLVAHKLDKVGHQDRAALINLGKHAKVTAQVLRTTTSRSPRLIWENEVRQKVAFTSVGKGLLPEVRVMTIRIVPLETSTTTLRLPISTYKPEPTVLTLTARRESSQAMEVPTDAGTSQSAAVAEIVDNLRRLAVSIERGAVEAVADHLLDGDAEVLSEVERALGFAARLKDALDRRAAEPRPLKLVN